ncbi:MAG: hypothetical protein ACREN5_09070, partial [Gemmatimonadales bacterium]
MGAPAPHGAQRPHRQPRPRDGGHIAAFEAVFIFMLFLTSIALVPAFQRSIDTGVRESMESQVADLLTAFEALPTQDAFQRTADRIVARAHQGNTTEFDDIIHRGLPHGTECSLYLDNGKEQRRLLGSERPSGIESVSAAHLWRPTWAYAFAVPTTQVLGNHTPLALQGYQVSQGSMVKRLGVPVEVTVTTSNGTYTAGAVVAVTEAPSASINTLSEGGMPTWITTTSGTLPSSEVFHVNLTSTSGPYSFQVPADTGFLTSTITSFGTMGNLNANIAHREPDGDWHNVTVTAPGGRTVLALPSTQGTWSLEATGRIQNGAWVDVSITSTPSDAWRNLTLAVRSTSNSLPAGTQLTLDLPAELSLLLDEAWNPAWTNLQ